MAKSLVKMDYYRNHGWKVAVTFRGHTEQRCFHNGMYGGSGRARQLAVAWRDATEQRLGKPRTARTLQARRDKTCGIYHHRGRKPCVIAAFQVRPYTTLRKQWSVRKYGLRGAWRLALAWRHCMERRYYGAQVGEEKA